MLLNSRGNGDLSVEEPRRKSTEKLVDYEALHVDNGESDCEDGFDDGKDHIIEKFDCSIIPDYVQAVWKEKLSKRQYVSVALLLPSGSEQLKGNVRTLIENRTALILKFHTTLAFRKSERLHGQWMVGRDGVEKVEEYHPRIAAFQDAMDLRKETQGLYKEKTARIELPFDARPRLTEKYYLGWEKSYEIVVCCTMESLAEPDEDDEDDHFNIVIVPSKPEVSNIRSVADSAPTSTSN